MLNKIIELSIKHSFIVIIFTLILSFLGVKSLFNNKYDAIPDLSDKQVIINVEFNGQSPTTIEQQVTYPLTQNFLGIPETKTVRAVTMTNQAYIYIIFNDNVDLYWARSRVLEHINQNNNIPSDVNISIGEDASGVGWIYQYALIDKTNTLDNQKLTEIHDFIISPKLKSIQGVANIATVGGYKKTYEINILPEKLLQHNLTIEQIIKSINEQNREVGGSIIQQGEKEFLVQSKSLFKNIDEIKNTFIEGLDYSLKLSDITIIKESSLTRRGIADLNGDGEVVGGIVIMRYNENPLNTIKQVKQEIKNINKSLPTGVEFITVYDRSKLITNSIDNIIDKITIEIITVFIVCLIFFFSIKNSFAVIFTVPISILLLFITTEHINLTLNIMSLGGIIISIGVIVDAAIVFIDNTQRRIQENGFTNETIVKSCQEIAPSIFSSLFIILISFTPLFLLTGQESKMFEPLVLTKTIIMIFSTIISITFIPAIIKLFISKKAPDESNHFIIKHIQNGYKNIIQLFLKVKLIPLSLFITVTIGGFYSVSGIKYEFLPELNEGDLLYMPTTLPSISAYEAQELLQVTNKLIKKTPEVKTVFGKIGRAETSTDPAPLTMIETTIQLKDRSEWREGFTLNDIIDELNHNVDIPSLNNSWTQPIKTRLDMLSTGIKSPMGLKITGNDFKSLNDTAKKIESKLKDNPSIQSVFAERINGGTYLNIIPDREKLYQLNIPMSVVNQHIEFLLGGKQIDTVFEKRNRFPIQIRYPLPIRNSIYDIENLPVIYKDNVYLLSDLAEVKIETNPSMIKTENSELVSYVYIYPKNNDFQQTIKTSTEIIDNIDLDGNFYQWIGDYQKLQETESSLKTIIPIILIICFIIIYLLFKSIGISVINLTSIVFSTAGALFFLNFFNQNISISTYVGLIALIGLSIELSILMTTYILNENGTSIEKIINGSVKRLRPKIITALTIIISLYPVVFWSGVGNEFLKAISFPLFFGIIFAFFYALFILPILLYFSLKRVD